MRSTAFFVAFAVACGGSSGSPGKESACVPGHSIACACVTGNSGAQACLSDGSGYSSCSCADDGSGGTSPGTGGDTGTGGLAAGGWAGGGGGGHAGVGGKTVGGSGGVAGGGGAIGRGGAGGGPAGSGGVGGWQVVGTGGTGTGGAGGSTTCIVPAGLHTVTYGTSKFMSGADAVTMWPVLVAMERQCNFDTIDLPVPSIPSVQDTQDPRRSVEYIVSPKATISWSQKFGAGSSTFTQIVGAATSAVYSLTNPVSVTVAFQ